MTQSVNYPRKKSNCQCCLEEKKLYSCGIKQCSWEVCENCYKKIYAQNSMCPACRNCVEYKHFSPEISPLSEVYIDVNELESVDIVIRRSNCGIFKKIYKFLCIKLCVPVLEMFLVWIVISLAIFIGRWVMWILDCYFPIEFSGIFWLPLGWFILVGLLGILVAIGLGCLASLFICRMCSEDDDHW